MTPEKNQRKLPVEIQQVDVVGGKGHNLLKLLELSKEMDFKVPKFNIIPADTEYTEPQLKKIFESLSKPLIIRSSSPHEDLKNLSYAGKFKSVLGIEDFQSFKKAINEVLESAKSSRVKNYAELFRSQHILE